MRAIITGILFFVTFQHAVAETIRPPLRFGLLPYVSTQRLIERYTPLRDYLEHVLERRVILVTAPDFRTYVSRAEHREYDLYLTAPHFAALAEKEVHYRRVSRLTRELRGAFVISRQSTIKSVNDLRGKIVAAPNATAIVTMLGETLLEQNGMALGKNVFMQYTPSHNNALMAVANGKADAAVVSAAVYDTMPDETKTQLKILAVTPSVPHMMFMASPELNDEDYLQLKNAMLGFTADRAGKTFFAKNSYGDMSEISDAQMRQLRPYVNKLQARLKEK